MDGAAVADAVVRGVLERREVGAHDGTIVLLHSWPSGTADGIESMVARLRDAGNAKGNRYARSLFCFWSDSLQTATRLARERPERWMPFTGQDRGARAA